LFLILLVIVKKLLPFYDNSENSQQYSISKIYNAKKSPAGFPAELFYAALLLHRE
jgi:hypothetical protein